MYLAPPQSLDLVEPWEPSPLGVTEMGRETLEIAALIIATPSPWERTWRITSGRMPQLRSERLAQRRRLVGANLAGGYFYRICKMPHGGISYLTEECFQEGHLDFTGHHQWVQYAKDKKSGHRTELRAKQTTEGTYPEGSMWRANPLIPWMEEDGDKDHGHGHIYDNIQVPSDLEPGEYVVSFRWDSKCSPQVWGSCATVRIV